MPFAKNIPSLFVESALLKGVPMTALESLLVYNYADIAKKVVRLKKAGFRFVTRYVKLSEVIARIEAANGGPVTLGKLPKSAKPETPILVIEYVLERVAANDRKLNEVLAGLLPLKEAGLLPAEIAALFAPKAAPAAANPAPVAEVPVTVIDIDKAA